MKGSLSAKIIRWFTGREGYHLKDDRPTAHVEVQRFILELCQGEDTDWNRLIETDETAQKINRDFKDSIEAGIRGTYFRGRRFAASVSELPSSEFWAPRKGKQQARRYNEFGERVLYLSRNVETVAAECPSSVEKPKLFIQKFALNLPSGGRVAMTLDLEKSRPFLHYLLLDSEYAPEKTAKFANLRNPYRATHFLAHLARLNGVLGIEYPSIQGDIQRNSTAINLVLMGEAEAMTDGAPFMLADLDQPEPSRRFDAT